MVFWRLLAPISLVILRSMLVVPQCLVCSRNDACEHFDGRVFTETNITIKCETAIVKTANQTEDVELPLYNTTWPTSDTSSTPIPSSHKGNLIQPSIADSFFNNTTIFANVKYLNFSHNAVNRFKGTFNSLVVLDLSFNVITDISCSQFHSPQLAHLAISNNNLKSLCNFSHSALQYLDARNNKISRLCIGSLPKLKSLNLCHNEITNIDKNIVKQTPKLEILNLSNNSIAQLNDYNFNLSSLLRLYLGNNEIIYLSEKCFYGLNRLQFLDISDNKITTVFPSMFQYIPLVQLVVSDNPQLMTQDFGILLASERLKSVNASRTNQNKIPACLTRSVRYLSLSHNTITQIQSGDLDSYPLLNSLDLSFNNIRFIEDDALGRLELLETILLGNNQLTFIPYTLPSNLKALYLDHNHIKKVIPSDFTGLLKLKHLDLSSSNVNFIAEGSFSQMYGLFSLNLSMNPIKVVSIGTFAGPHKLKVLDLSGLGNLTKCNQDLCFPVPEPNELSELYIRESPELGHRLMNDAAALKTFKQLNTLNMESCNLTDIIGDMANYFPRMKTLCLGKNEINCSKIHDIYSWSDITETGDCTFLIKEKTTTTVPSPTVGSTARIPEAHANLTSQYPETPSTTDISLESFIRNNSLHYSEEAEVISNEIWITDDQLGVVDAYSGEAPSSHPGLFVMLLLPLTLAGAVLIFNYSRLKRKIRTERRCEMEIEISNISSELW